MSLFGKKIEAHLGVDIGAHGIKLVELHKTKGRPQLWTYGMLHDQTDIHADAAMDKVIEEPLAYEAASLGAPVNPLEQERAANEAQKALDPTRQEKRISIYANRLKDLFEQAGVQATAASASLPVSQVFHTAITLPAVDPKELDHHVRAKVKKMLPMPIEKMQVVHQRIPDDPKDAAENKRDKYTRVLVTAASKELVSFYTRIFKESGMVLADLETEAFALQRALVGTDMGTAMIIDIGAERSNFFIVERTVPLTHRSIQIGGKNIDAIVSEQLGIEPEKVGQVKRDLSRLPKRALDSEKYMSVLDPIVKEIAYNIDMFTRQTGNELKRIEKIILTGGTSLFPPIAEVISRKFSMNVFVGDPWARVVYQAGLKRVLDEIGPTMAVSIGLAMRNIV